MTIRVWDLLQGVCRHTLTGIGLRTFTVLNVSGHLSLTGLMILRGNILVSANADSTLRIWDVETGECRSILRGHRSAVTCLTFDDNYITRFAVGFSSSIHS